LICLSPPAKSLYQLHIYESERGDDVDFNLTEEEELFHKTVREFCETKLMPRAREIDTKEEIPQDVLDGMAELGLLGITIPGEYGGPGGSMMMATLAAIEIGRGDISMATAVFYLLEAGWSLVLANCGTEEAKQEVLPEVARARAFMGIATTEPGGGSDIANVKTIAKPTGDGYVLNGEKAYISCVKEAQRMGGGHLTIVRTKPELGHRGMGFFYVPIATEGITTTLYSDMGRMGISTGGISYSDAKIPKHYLLGEETRGFYHLMAGFNVARTLVAAACIGASERALEIGTEYIKERKLFGRPIGKFEGIQFELAEQFAQVEMAKNTVLKAAWMIDKYGDDKSKASEITKTATVVKLYAPQIAFETVKKAMIWYGAAGYTKDVDLEMGLRGVTSYIVGAEGALNIMKVILGRELLGKEFIPYK
jgi:acyl-CoA dehydrogenase